jgi:alkanesulfonate monooxygenase SsuD/methylene tetrahydromethanopterin reductase-like flavin-dependent oxidoreductase (luciferase family)
MSSSAGRDTTARSGQMTTGRWMSSGYPITAAKAAATLDLLARERVSLGVGAGWLKEEYDALAKDFSDRGKRTNESIAAIRQLWSQSPAAFSSQTVSFPALY